MPIRPHRIGTPGDDAKRGNSGGNKTAQAERGSHDALSALIDQVRQPHGDEPASAKDQPHSRLVKVQPVTRHPGVLSEHGFF